jgi:hypothetical protein
MRIFPLQKRHLPQMKNCALLLLLLPVILLSNSCSKNKDSKLAYGIDSVSAIYVNYDDTTNIPMLVRFLSGSYRENVSLVVTGMPAKVKYLSDTVTGQPTFTANFKFAADSAPLGMYPIQIVTYSQSTGFKTYALNLGVVRNACTNYLQGSYRATNTCTDKGFTYAVTATSTSGNTMNLVNFGGYGNQTNTELNVDCNTNSVKINKQSIGNGVTVEGTGSFNENSITLRYIALNTPTGRNDTCTAVLMR